MGGGEVLPAGFNTSQEGVGIYFSYARTRR